MKLGGKINGWVFSVCTSIRIREKQQHLQQEKRRGESGIESDKCYWKVYVTSCHNRNYFHSQIYIGRNWLFTFVVVVFSLFFCLQFSLLTLYLSSLSLSLQLPASPVPLPQSTCICPWQAISVCLLALLDRSLLGQEK